MGLLLGSLRKCSGEDSVENRELGLSLKHHTAPLGAVLFSWRNNRIWYFTYQEQWGCLSMNPHARDREKNPAEAHAQHYVIMTADPRKMKGHLMQPLERASCLIVQHGWQQYYLKWGGLKQEWNEWKDQFLGEYVSFPSHSKGTVFIFCTAVRMFIRVGSEGNCHYESCRKMRLFT